jgi:thiamine pyrophosphate-dependent acetolactate synthase large subunit-like protein
MEASGKTGSMGSVVSQAIAASRSGTPGEASSLLPKDISDEKTDNGIFSIFQNLTRNFSSSD